MGSINARAACPQVITPQPKSILDALSMYMGHPSGIQYTHLAASVPFRQTRSSPEIARRAWRSHRGRPVAAASRRRRSRGRTIARACVGRGQRRPTCTFPPRESTSMRCLSGVSAREFVIVLGNSVNSEALMSHDVRNSGAEPGWYCTSTMIWNDSGDPASSRAAATISVMRSSSAAAVRSKRQSIMGGRV